MKESNVFFDRHLAQTTMYPIGLKIVDAKGIYLHSEEGKKYMDMVSGIGVSNLGHGHPKIIDAICEQARRHLHVMVYGEFVQSAQEKAAALLCELLPSSLDACYFVNSGTEANEAALKLAKRITGRTRIISFRGAYHGSTHGSLSVSSNEIKKAAFRPLLPDVYFIHLNRFEDLEMIDENVACVILETVQGDAGVRIPSKDYMIALRKKCSEQGALLLLDEIQCGMGRTGKMFAFEHFGIVPDILTLGKALGAGMPVGCVIASQAHMKCFTNGPMLGHISTFAGHPVVCAAVAAGLEVMKEENILEQVELLGCLFQEKLVHPMIREVRRMGLFFAIELENETVVQRTVEECLERGLIAFWFLSCPHAFRIAPPLMITRDEVEKACSIIIESLNHIHARP